MKCAICKRRVARPNRRSCKKCASARKEYMKKWYQAHKVRVRRWAKRYRRAHPEKAIAWSTAYNKKTKDAVFDYYG